MKKITIITGHYGSGKTNVSVNMAMDLAKQNKKVTIVDLDIVNPYFRTADFKDMFEKNGITLVSSIYANSNLDIPAISFDVERITREDGYVIIDVGGDDDGATALGRYYEPFLKLKDDIDMLYIINKYRYLDSDFSEAVTLIDQIEKTARFKHTGIINNSNLGKLTTKEIIIDAFEFAKNVSKEANLPLIYSTAPKFLKTSDLDNKVKYNEVYVKPLWE